MAKDQITKPRAISGFPEWLPEQQRLQDQWMDSIRSVFESFGYQHLETAAVELTEVLAAKGVEQKKSIASLDCGLKKKKTADIVYILI